MAMSRKDYREAAEIIKRRDSQALTSGEHHIALAIACDLAAMFAGDNPRFDREKFLDACGLN